MIVRERKIEIGIKRNREREKEKEREKKRNYCHDTRARARARQEAFRDAPVRAGVVVTKEGKKREKMKNKTSIKYMRGRGEEGTFLLFRAKKKEKKTPDGRPPPLSAMSVGILSSRKEEKKKR